MRKFALVGNPNSGKTTLFNSLTGSTAHVGNWPGVTVDKKVGVYKKASEQVEIVDLPGIYSLSPYTSEEVISRNYILDEKPECVINIVDVTNLERNLYLTTQIMEIDVPVVVALNMMDMLERQGDKIDEKQLEKRLGVPVIKISAFKSEGLDELMDRAIEFSKNDRKGVSVLEGGELEHLIGDVRIALEGQGVDNSLFHAVKLVENDEIEMQMHPQTVKMVDDFKKTFDSEVFGSDIDALVADARYKHISKYYSPLLVRSNKGIKFSKSDKADRVLTNKWVGIPIFLVILFGIFHLTFSENFLWLGSIFNLPTIESLNLPDTFWTSLLACVYDGVIYSPGVILFNLMELLTSTLFEYLGGLIESLGASSWVIGLFNDGIFAGLGGILSFIPQIVFLLLLISILEDSGYMARVAFILDKLFRKFGVSGRAFIPMIMGFGCSVPAMINTRTLADDREKIMTLRVIPFFTCGAKVPILVAVAGAIVSACGFGNADIITYSMYVLGLAVAVISIILMRSTTQKGEIAPFIMELPAYHAPSFKNLMIHMWDKAKHYIEKAFTIILFSTILIWFLSNFGWDWKMCEIDSSILASIGKFMQPIFTPLGFGSQLGTYGWVFVVAAITGLIAKENVIATFATLAGCIGATLIATEDGAFEVAEIIRYIASDINVSAYSLWPAMISFIVFNMTTIPCFASVATARGELKKGTAKWTILFWVLTSYMTSTIVYLVLSWWWTSFIVIGIAILSAICIKIHNKRAKVK
ncbi:MAG: ferrous iron transporter B [Clostridiales bacterium]|nr:ferrous iron transporter B [Clostridiales bacterium]